MKNDLTLEDILKIVPLDEPVRQEIQRDFNTYSEAKKFEMKKILWDGLNELDDEMTEIKFQQFMLEVEEGKRKVSGDLYEQARQAVWQDFTDILSGKKKEVDEMKQIRQKLQVYMPQ